MVLVALGLLLIVLRIHWRKSNTWLININGAALLGVLYASCFINFGGIIATYNVTHPRTSNYPAYPVFKMVDGVSQQIPGDVDIAYLQYQIGPEAIPALIWLKTQMPKGPARKYIREVLQQLKLQLEESTQNWRRWTFRDYRLLQLAKEEGAM